MKVAVSANGSDPECEVDRRFGRAPGFVIVDTEDGSHYTVPNVQDTGAAQGAGIQAAQLVIDRKVDAVITGNCGPKAYRLLTAAGVKVFTAAGVTVRDAVESYRKGLLVALDAPNVEGHW